eukprot:g1596.t1
MDNTQPPAKKSQSRAAKRREKSKQKRLRKEQPPLAADAGIGSANGPQAAPEKKKQRVGTDGGAGAGSASEAPVAAAPVRDTASADRLPPALTVRGGSDGLAGPELPPLAEVIDPRPGPNTRGHELTLDALLDERSRSRQVFEWLIAPLDRDTFYREHWERRPVVVRRNAHNSTYYAGWLDKPQVERMLRRGEGAGEDSDEGEGEGEGEDAEGAEPLQYDLDVDITRYDYVHGDDGDSGGDDGGGGVPPGEESTQRTRTGEGTRVTLNPGGAVDARTVWRHVAAGCSFRLLRPQQHSRAVWRLMHALQNEWGSMAGANAYYTPAGAQGFSPHFDDVEAFALQLHGRKTWLLYAPQDLGRALPRRASRNFSQKELPARPYARVTLRPGDMLYFPRGWVHQCVCAEAEPSLHLTVSCAHRSTWADFMDELVPNAVARAALGGSGAALALRAGLPRDMFDYMGLVHADAGAADGAAAADAGADGAVAAGGGGERASDPRAARGAARRAFIERARALLAVVHAEAQSSLDVCADAWCRDALHQGLPPPLLPGEEGAVEPGLWRRLGIVGSASAGARAAAGKARAKGKKEFGPLDAITDSATEVRLVRPRCARLILDEGVLVLHHSLLNGRTMHAHALPSLEFEPSDGPALEVLLTAYPAWTQVGLLPLKDDDDRLELATALYQEGVIMVKR